MIGLFGDVKNHGLLRWHVVLWNRASQQKCWYNSDPLSKRKNFSPTIIPKNVYLAPINPIEKVSTLDHIQLYSKQNCTWSNLRVFMKHLLELFSRNNALLKFSLHFQKNASALHIKAVTQLNQEFHSEKALVSDPSLHSCSVLACSGPPSSS